MCCGFSRRTRSAGTDAKRHLTSAGVLFFNLYASREPTYPVEGNGQWGEDEFRRRLAELGEQCLTLLLISDQSRSWAIYLNEKLSEVLAYHGRSLPGVRYSIEQDEDDVAAGVLVRSLIPEIRATIAKLDMSRLPAVHVELLEASGRRWNITFPRWHMIRRPPDDADAIRSVDEIRGATGRIWFVFDLSTMAAACLLYRPNPLR